MRNSASADSRVTWSEAPSVAAKTALREMITLIGERLGLSPEDAYMFCSLAVDMRVTQLVDGNKGIHAMLPKRYANSPN